MNKLIIELSGFEVEEVVEEIRNPFGQSGGAGLWIHQPCQKTHADGDNALSKTIMLQIYIPKTI